MKENEEHEVVHGHTIVHLFQGNVESRSSPVDLPVEVFSGVHILKDGFYLYLFRKQNVWEVTKYSDTYPSMSSSLGQLLFALTTGVILNPPSSYSLCTLYCKAVLDSKSLIIVRCFWTYSGQTTVSSFEIRDLST